MAEKVVIRLEPPWNAPDQMKVQDAFAQVIDLFNLVVHADPSTEEEVEWRLVSVSMNSPLTVVAEAASTRLGIDVEPIARRQKLAFRSAYAQLRRGSMPAVWNRPKQREVATRFLTRNARGIGRTTVETADAFSPEVFTTEEAAAAVIELNRHPAQATNPKDQMGSIEGRLANVETWYDQPALKVIESKTGLEVWCVISKGAEEQFSHRANFEDVWKGSRVSVRGRVHYDAEGKLARVHATSIKRIETAVVLEDDIADRDFTSGVDSNEYLRRLRDGELG